MPRYAMYLGEEKLEEREAKSPAKAVLACAEEHDLTLLEKPTRHTKCATPDGEHLMLRAYTQVSRAYYGRGDDEHLFKLGVKARRTNEGGKS